MTMLCAHCEKRPGASGDVPVPLCLECRTASYERTAAEKAKPVTLSFTPSAEELLVRDAQLRIARGEGCGLLEVDHG